MLSINLNKKIVAYYTRKNCHQWDPRDKLFASYSLKERGGGGEGENKPFKREFNFPKILDDPSVARPRLIG